MATYKVKVAICVFSAKNIKTGREDAKGKPLRKDGSKNCKLQVTVNAKL